jgi:hypothetical protein
MEKVRKTFFNPLVTSKAKVIEILENLPVGSAHPFSPEQILLCRSENGIIEIDTSSYQEDFFFNAVDLGEMGEILLTRMAKFNQLSTFFSQLVSEREKTPMLTVTQRFSRTSRSCKHQIRHSRSQ